MPGIMLAKWDGRRYHHVFTLSAGWVDIISALVLSFAIYSFCSAVVIIAAGAQIAAWVINFINER